MFRFLKTTVLGGVLFLVPIVIFIAVIGKALQLTDMVAAPIARLLPVQSVGGLAVVELIALALLIVVCFIAGLAARTTVAGKLCRARVNLISYPWLQQRVIKEGVYAEIQQTGTGTGAERL